MTLGLPCGSPPVTDAKNPCGYFRCSTLLLRRMGECCVSNQPGEKVDATNPWDRSPKKSSWPWSRQPQELWFFSTLQCSFKKENHFQWQSEMELEVQMIGLCSSAGRMLTYQADIPECVPWGSIRWADATHVILALIKWGRQMRGWLKVILYHSTQWAWCQPWLYGFKTTTTNCVMLKMKAKTQTQWHSIVIKESWKGRQSWYKDYETTGQEEGKR